MVASAKANANANANASASANGNKRTLDAIGVLSGWMEEIRHRNVVYWEQSRRLERRAMSWSIPNVILSSLTGLGATAQALGPDAPKWVTWASAAAGIGAGITASLIRVFRYHERSSAARELAKRFAILLHDAEAALASAQDAAAPTSSAIENRETVLGILARVRAEFNRLVETAEEPPTLLWASSKRLREIETA